MNALVKLANPWSALEISFWVHLLDHERNGQTGKYMKRARNFILGAFMHPEWNSILIFTFLNKEMRYIYIQFYIKSACFKWIK